MPDPILLTIDAEKAVVALDAVTYQRVDIAQKVANAALALKDKSIAYEAAEAALSTAKAELEKAQYELDLYQSILAEFQNRYPVGVSEEASETKDIFEEQSNSPQVATEEISDSLETPEVSPSEFLDTPVEEEYEPIPATVVTED